MRFLWFDSICLTFSDPPWFVSKQLFITPNCNQFTFLTKSHTKYFLVISLNVLFLRNFLSKSFLIIQHRHENLNMERSLKIWRKRMRWKRMNFKCIMSSFNLRRLPKFSKFIFIKRATWKRPKNAMKTKGKNDFAISTYVHDFAGFRVHRLA